MRKIDVGETDEGFVEVSMAGATMVLDLWETCNKLAALKEQVKDRPTNEQNEAVVELIRSLGFPQVSYRWASRFMQQIGLATEESKKKDSEGTESPGSTPATTRKN